VALKIFHGGSNKFFRALLKLGQARLTAEGVLVSLIRGSEFVIGRNACAANRVQVEVRRQVFLMVFLEFSQTLETAKDVIPPLTGGPEQALRGYLGATDGIFLDWTRWFAIVHGSLPWLQLIIYT
jgi:hypothetical protein